MLVLLLNYINWLVVALVLYVSWKRRPKEESSDKKQEYWMVRLVIAALLWGALLVVQNAAVPKTLGTVERPPVPVYEKRDDLVIQDRLRKNSKTDEEAKRDFAKMVDWEAKRDSAKAKEE